jgi:ABC-type multidrug transport system fused ATPase/permease subunit
MINSKAIKFSACLRRLYEMSEGYRAMLVANGAIGVVSVAASLAFVAVSKQLVDIATGVAAGQMTHYVVALLLLMALQISLSLTSVRIGTKCSIGMTNTVRRRIFERLMKSRWCCGNKLHTGDMVNRLEEDVRVVVDTVSNSFPTTVVALVQLAAAFSFLLMLEPRLAWTVLLIMPAAFLLSKVYMTRMRRLTREIRDTDSRVQEHVQEHIQHRTLIASLERTNNSVGQLSALQGQLSGQVMRRMRFSLFSRGIVQAGFSAGYIVAFLWGIYGLRSGAVTFGMMTAFLQLVVQVQRPIIELGRQVPTIAHSMASVERIVELIELPAEEHHRSQRLAGEVGIRFENVSFGYTDEAGPVLSDFSHDFRPASFTALVGETGVGKSTLMRLIMALVAPDSGEIKIYNDEKALTATPDTRCNIVYVPQGNTLMSGTIRDNLLLGSPDATDEEMRSALHTAVADFVLSLPDGLNSHCGEGGVGLSEGQAQRIAIARGLLRPGSILLLDEPTSSIDPETEHTLINRLRAEAERRTVIVVTHREQVMNLCTECCYLGGE